VSDLPGEAAKIVFNYRMMTDSATRGCAQVAETDAKITDSEGWTYDLSAQWEMQKNAPDWTFQVDDESWSWTDSGIIVPPPRPYQPREYSIDYRLDYANKQSAIAGVTVNGQVRRIPSPRYIPARQEGWEKKQIVSQLQQCNNYRGGGYVLRFTDVGYTFA
jgi:hypothetical protein